MYIKRGVKHKLWSRKYSKTPQRKKYARDYHKRRCKTDIEFKLKARLRTRLYLALKRRYKSGSAVRDLGCTIPELIKLLESKFKPGMTWENYGKWHIDHSVPLSSFDLAIRDQLLIACHFTNLQPMWAVENIQKSDKVGAPGGTRTPDASL